MTMRIAVFGGSGFVGRRLTAELCARGHEVVVPTRDRERAKEDLIILPGARAVGFDPDSPASVARALDGAEAVVNLMGILHERRPGDFERVHGEFVRRLVLECRGKVRLFAQVSALGAAPAADSAYLRSKAQGERIVRDAGAMRHVIVRPSVVFGRGDSFATMFAGLARFFPVMVLPCADAKFQPVAVEDLSRMIARAMEDGTLQNRILSAGGPEVFTLREMVEKVLNAAGTSRPIIPLGNSASHAFAAVAEAIPFVNIITRDNWRAMRIPSVCPRKNGGGNDTATILGMENLTSLETGLAQMFPRPPQNFNDFRRRARRG